MACRGLLSHLGRAGASNGSRGGGYDSGRMKSEIKILVAVQFALLALCCCGVWLVSSLNSNEIRRNFRSCQQKNSTTCTERSTGTRSYGVYYYDCTSIRFQTMIIMVIIYTGTNCS